MPTKNGKKFLVILPFVEFPIQTLFAKLKVAQLKALLEIIISHVLPIVST